MRTRRLLTTMRRQDVVDRVIMIIGFLVFISAVLYVVSKRVGLLKLQRKITAAIKSGSIGHEEIQEGIQKLGAGLHHMQGHGDPVPHEEIQLHHVYDEL